MIKNAKFIEYLLPLKCFSILFNLNFMKTYAVLAVYYFYYYCLLQLLLLPHFAAEDTEAPKV